VKEYNIKAIVEDDELKLLFECDQEKNIECKGNGNCRECSHTTNSKYIKANDINTYSKARNRIERITGKNVTDKELVTYLEQEIGYYRHKIERLTNEHKKDKETIKENDELIREHQEVLKEIIFKKADILKIRTPNQIRKLTGYKPIDPDTNNKVTVGVKLEAEEAIQKLEQIKTLCKEIKDNALEIGIDFAQEKDYTTTQTYVGEKMVKEETTYYK